MNSHLATSPIFVVGYMHSGTTLLQNILKAEPTIFASQGETRFFDYLPLIQRKFPNLQDEQTLRNFVVHVAKLVQTNYGTVNVPAKLGNRKTLEDFGLTQAVIDELLVAAAQLRDHARIFPLVYDRLTAAAGKTRWLEKTPDHLFHIEAILRVAPTARFVELVRDPRDILASKRSRHTKEWTNRFADEENHFTSLSTGFDPCWDTLAWKSAIRAVDQAKAQHPESILRVRYEDLVSDPVTVVQRICAFLGITYRDAMLDVGWINTTTQAVQGSRGISAASTGKWKQQLTPEMVALCQLLAKRELQAMHYNFTTVTLATRLKMPLLIGRSGMEFFERLARRWRMGGFDYVRNVLNKYWIRLDNVSRG